MKILNHPLFILAIILCIGAEYVYSKKKGIENYAVPETLTSIALISFDKILGLLTGTDGGPMVTWLWSHRFFDLPVNHSTGLVLTFIAAELMYYCNHWYNHHVNIGWATHIMHHSPTKYNLTLGYRLGITRLFSLGWLVFLPLILFGFKPEDIALCIGIIFLYQFFIHTELVPRLGILDVLFNTPSAHRIHHSGNPHEYNKNLGGITLLFDHLFGTYARESEEGVKRYGIARVMKKKSLWFEITAHWRVVYHRFIQANSMKERVLALFGSPSKIR
jgi:sterol desaturase/sphingolipid hydroxylase (fatty acid hydroxylase superfamily)